MNKRQMGIVWTVGLLVSAVLFYAGIGAPYLVEREHAKSSPPSGTILEYSTEEGRSKIEERKSAWLAERERGTAKNYLVGVALPLLILGACTFLQASSPRPPEAPRP